MVLQEPSLILLLPIVGYLVHELWSDCSENNQQMAGKHQNPVDIKASEPHIN